jgi:hypothetical protein
MVFMLIPGRVMMTSLVVQVESQIREVRHGLTLVAPLLCSVGLIRLDRLDFIMTLTTRCL